MTANRVLIALFVISALSACSHKAPKEDVTEVSPAPNAVTDDSNIENKDINLDSTGSDSGKIPGLVTVHFEYDKSTLTQEARNDAQKDADWMKSHPTDNLQIEGHCDRHGSIEYNLALGERRANALKKYLVDLGVNKSKLSTISYGKERLLDQAESDAADAKNRRGNFKVVSAPVENRRF